MDHRLTHRLAGFVESQRLPDSFQTVINDYYLPVATWIHENLQHHDCPVVGINGAQGTGKSTFSAVLKIILAERYGWQAAILSLDDLYLSRAERQILAKTVHPLLQTRGVPGSHDTQLGIDIIARLKNLKPGQSIQLPRFDKALDDRKPIGEWEVFTGPTDLIIFEGWCLGSRPVNPDELITPVNSLEAEEDSDGVWRNYINQKLQSEYRDLFAVIDKLIMLKAPDFDSIRRWRLEQEQKLATATSGTNQIMDEPSLLRFIQHYERLTLHNLTEMPSRADAVLTLDSHHQVTKLYYKKTPN